MGVSAQDGKTPFDRRCPDTLSATLLIDFTNPGDLECRLQRCNVQRWGPVPPKQELCCNVVCLVDIVQCTRQDFALDFALK